MAPNGTISGYRDPGLGVVTQDEIARAWALALGISFFTFLPLRHAHIHELLPLYRYCAHLSKSILSRRTKTRIPSSSLSPGLNTTTCPRLSVSRGGNLAATPHVQSQ